MTMSPNRAAVNPAGTRRNRRWRYRLAALILVPALFFGLLELGLRGAGFGDPTGFFLDGAAVGARGSYVENRVYCRRFFPPSLAEVPPPLPFAIAAAKPAGTFRIFILGESAAQGFPDPWSSFARVLEVMLRERYPATRFEVINTAMVAINSHVIVPIARECAGHEPDLFIVLMGNNEVVGPFGAAGVLGAYAPHRALIRANLAAKTTRTGQLLNRLVQGFGSEDRTREWEGMAAFVNSHVRADNPRLQGLYDHFRANLEDICTVAMGAGVPMVVCTVPVNLQDCPPFASDHDPGLSADQVARWDEHFQAGVKAEAADQWAEAVGHYRAADAIDDTYAELAFRLGRCQAALGSADAAHRAFAQARDLDTLRFRCDTALNAAIRAVCAGRDAAGIRLVDAEQAFAASSPSGSPGADLFYEHVHMNFHGNALLARTIFPTVQALLPGAVRSAGPDAGPDAAPPTEAECAAWLAQTDWGDYLVAMQLYGKLLQQPPFTTQLDHAALIRRWEKRRAMLRDRIQADGRRTAVAAYEKAISRAAGDWMLHMSFAWLLAECGEPAKAIAQYEEALETLPHDFPAQAKIGELLMKMGQADAAVRRFRVALRIAPDYTEARCGLAEALAAQGKTDEALATCAPMLAQPATRPRALVLTGRVLAKAGRTGVARARFAEALQANPDDVAAHLNLGDLAVREDKTDEALVHYEAAMRLRPDVPGLTAIVDKLRKKL